MTFNEKPEGTEEVMSEINMIPLVDIMMVLLIIFIITIPVVTHSTKIDLPQTETAHALMPPQIVTLSITREGHILWNNTPVDAAELEKRLSIAATRKPQPEIHFHGDRQAAYDHVAKAMTAAQRAGILKLGFITRP